MYSGILSKLIDVALDVVTVLLSLVLFELLSCVPIPKYPVIPIIFAIHMNIISSFKLFILIINRKGKK